MGAKPPDQINLRRPTLKCDICGRKFLNVQALKSHHQFLHLKPDGKRPQFKKRIETKPLNKKVIPVNMLKRVMPSKAAKQVEKSDVKELKEDTKPAGKKHSERKAKFECPVCSAIFSVYFSAFRHIQKNHCVDENGEEVPANSPALVKPIRQEYCITCEKQIRSTERHECAKPTIPQDQYKCLGCNQTFTGLVMFQHHIKGMHEDGSQNYFFPIREEFMLWKQDLEDQTEAHFVRLNYKKTKEVYHCSHQPNVAAAVSHLCPSIITVRTYKSGIHVTYFKEHHGHVLKIPNFQKYSKNSFSLHVQNSEEMKVDAEEDNDLYLQLKTMVSCIVSDASKVDVSTLKELLGKALEMTTILKGVDGGDKSLHVPARKSLTDAQISCNLESLKSKRKQSPVPKDVKKDTKKSKKDSDEALIENGVNTKARGSPALNKSVTLNKNSKKNNDTEKKEDPMQKPLIQSPTSFNESYKNFVDQNFKALPDTSTPKPKSNVRKKEVVKTKIGQFKVKPSSLSPKDSLFNDSLPKDAPGSPITWKVKPDFKYEVKEQENDCNILILKI